MHDLFSVSPQRIRNLFRMDWHRMIHGKAFYVMAAIAIFMPVMMLTQMSDVQNVMMFVGSSDAVSGGFGAGMNLSILTVLTGMFLSISISKEYSSGIIKNIIAAHANKCDYIISKSIIALICNAVFIVLYLLTLFILGSLMGLPMGMPSVFGLILYLFEKLLLSIPMSALMIAINLIFRSSCGWSIVFVCIAGTGIIVTSLTMGLQMLGLGALANILNFTISGASNFASLTPNLLSLLAIIAVTVVWTLICTFIGNQLMNKRDVI